MAFREHKESKKSTFRKEKERISKRFQMNLEAIIAKYDHPFEGSDVLDLDDMTIVEDRGFLSSRKQMKIGMTKLASDKASSVSRSGINWNSTKNSTDSAIGSTRYSESEDTSGTETITNCSYRIPSIDNVVEDDKAIVRHGDVWMKKDSPYKDSGNEDADSDHSGHICRPSKSPLQSGLPQRHQRNQDSIRDSVKQASRPSVRGNLSRRFNDAEDSMKPKRELLCRARSLKEEEEDEEEDDDDPYEFREELPSILEEKNKFLFKMQSILVDSFLDGDEIDEMDSQTDDEISTENIESTEAVSGPISAWSTLPLKTPPKRSSKNPGTCQQKVDAVARKILSPRKAQGQKLSERDAVSGTDSDLTECSTILAGNLHYDRDDPRPSKLLLATGHERDSLRSRGSKAPFQAICNSTMLSEISPFEEVDMLNRKSPLDVDELRGHEVPLDGQGEMYLGEVPEIDNSNLKAHSLNEEGSKTPKAVSVNNVEYSTPRRPRLHVQSKEVPRGDEVDSEKDRGKPLTPSTRNHRLGDGRMDPLGHDVSGFTPRARLRRGVSFKQTPQSLSSPRFATNEIMEIFKSPKPLIIPGVDLNDLELTPKRKVKREAAATPTEPFRDTLLRLQSPVPQQKLDKTITPRRQKEKEIRLSNSALEVAVECATQGDASVRVKIKRDIDLSKRIVDLEERSSHVKRRQGMKTADEFFEDVSDVSPKVRKVPKSLDGDRRGSASPISKKPETPRKTAEKIQAPAPTHPTHGVDQRATPKSKRRGERQPNKQTCHNDQEEMNSDIRPDNSCRPKHAGDFPSGRTLRSSSDTKQLSVDNARKSHPQPRGATTEKPSNRPRPSMQTPNKEVTPDTQQRKPTTSPSSERTPRSRRLDGCPMTSGGQFSPSTLSSPFVHMSLASPSNLNGQKQDKLASDIKSKRPTVLGTRNKERSTVKQTQTKSAKEPAKVKSRTSDLNHRSRLDCTHMTIRYSDDTSEEEMEMDVDPYSLTADDSSLSPDLHQRRPELQPKGKPKTTKSYVPHKSNVGLKNCEHRTKGENHSKPSTQDCNKNLTTSVFKKSVSKDMVLEVMKTSQRSTVSGPSRSSINGRHSGNLTDSRQSRAAVRNTQSPGKRKMYSGVRKSPQDSPRPSPIHKVSAVPPEKERSPEKSSKYGTRREHSAYLSDEESNSSGDSAKFFSSIPHRDWHKDALDADWLTKKCMSPKRSGYSEQAVVSKHRTTIKCGQIISTPKSAKAVPMGSPSRQHRAHSPSHKGRVEKARKALICSPKRTHRKIELQSENMPSRTSSRLVSGGQAGIKMAARKLMASPSSRHSDSLREDGSSPMRASGCNVSSSYVCEGPGLCTKPFCFSCALGPIS